MAFEFVKECEPVQGFNFKQDEHHTVGYITQLVIGDANIAPDIAVVEPSLNAKFTAKSTGAGQGAEVSDTGKYNKSIVAVITNVTWSTNPTEPMKFTARVSVPNMQLLSLLTIQNLPKVVVRIGFIVYEYDPVNNKYFRSFASHKGTEPSRDKPGAASAIHGKLDSTVEPIYGVLGKEGQQLGIVIAAKASDDVAAPINHELQLTVSPTVARKTQEVLIQTSDTNKLIKGFGLPQA